MSETIQALTKLRDAVEREADAWRADHLLTITGDNNKILQSRNEPEP